MFDEATKDLTESENDFTECVAVLEYESPDRDSGLGEWRVIG
jgi:hypothetical protein